MQTFVQIIETIKGIKGLTHDYEVADLLGILKKAFAADKRRNSIPFFELATFCRNENIPLNWLLFDSGEKFNLTGLQGIKEIIPDYGTRGTFTEPPRHPAAALMPIPDVNNSGVDPSVQAMADIKEIFDSGDPILIPAIQANLHAFKRALQRERQFAQVLEENKDLRNRMTNLEALCADLPDLKIQFENLQTENRALRTENNRLKSTYEAPDGSNGDPTTLDKLNAEKKAM